MSRAPSTKTDPGLSALTGLSGLSGFNRQPLTPEQQMQALKRVQAQAEQRVKLGMQLFKAAEARLSSQTDIVQQIKTLQKQLREQVNNDVAQSLHQYDQWIGQIDESFTTAIRKLEEKVDAVQANISKSEARMRDMLDRAEAMLDQSRCLLQQKSLKLPEMPKPTNHVAPPASKSIAPQSPAAPVVAPKPTSQAPVPKSAPPAAKQTTPNADNAPVADPANIFLPGQPKSDSTIPRSDEGQEKIYSKLLQRLIEDAPVTDPAKGEGDATHKAEGNADAA